MTRTTWQAGEFEFLSEEELAGMTKRMRRKAQCRVLDLMGARYWLHPDGTPTVPRAQFRSTDDTIAAKEVEPDWEAVYGRKSA